MSGFVVVSVIDNKEIAGQQKTRKGGAYVMAQRTSEERLAKNRQKQERLKQEERKLKSQMVQAERKARTKRLIEIGGAVESVLGKAIEKEDLPKLIGFLKQQDERGGWFSGAMGVQLQKENYNFSEDDA